MKLSSIIQTMPLTQETETLVKASKVKKNILRMQELLDVLVLQAIVVLIRGRAVGFSVRIPSLRVLISLGCRFLAVLPPTSLVP